MNNTPPLEVAAAVIKRGRSILLALRKDKQGNPLGWEFPGGKREKGETFQEAARREIREELRCHILPLGTLTEVTAKTKEGRPIRMVAVAAEIERGVPKKKEHAALSWVPEKELATYGLLPPDIPIAKELQEHKIKFPSQPAPDGLALYVHFPFCLRKCAYCSFYSRPYSSCQSKAYMEALAKEIRRLLPALPYKRLSSVYFGGGTPSLIPIEQLQETVSAIRDCIEWPEDIEFTLECNPATGLQKNLEAYRSLGISRLSVGIQSFIESELRTLGRLHTAEQAKAAILAIRTARFPCVSLDLIYGVPGQTMESWRQSLDCALSLEPDHLSFYALSLEPNTPLAKAISLSPKTLSLPDDSFTMDQYWAARNIIKKGGYQMYEISNAAKPGLESRHNLAYWDTARHYLGLGPSAHGYCRLPGLSIPRRFHYAPNTELFIKNAQGALRVSHPLTLQQRKGERILLGLRRTKGVALTEEDLQFYAPQIEDLQKRELTSLKGQTLSLTKRGVELANQVMLEFL